MDKEKRLLWSIEEEAAELPVSQVAPEVEEAKPIEPKASVGEWRLAALIAFLGLFVIGGWMWYRSLDDDQPAEGEVTKLAYNEVQASELERFQWLAPPVVQVAKQVRQAQVESDLAELQLAIQDDDGDGERSVRTHVIDFYDDVAFVEVITLDMRVSPEKPTFRQTRVFRRTDHGWQPVAVTDDVWGAWQTWQTGNISIRYRPIDAEAVIEAAPKLDELYAKVRLDFGLPMTATIEPITIEVVPGKGADVYQVDAVTRTIQVASPASLLVPIETTASTVLFQSLVYPVSGLVLAEVEGHLPKGRQLNFAMWKPVIDAIRLWTLWEATEPLTVDHHQIARWLYQNRGETRIEARQDLSTDYSRRCATYPSWEVSPAALNVLQECKARLSPWRQPRMPTHLVEHIYGFWGGEAVDEGPLVTALTMETVIEYVVETYGRNALPQLIMGMGEHPNWQSLISAVFDTSAEEFEAGWQTYLANRYK